MIWKVLTIALLIGIASSTSACIGPPTDPSPLPTVSDR